MSPIDIFLAVILSATEVGNTRPSSSLPETVARIHEVGFYSLNSSTWDELSMGADALPSPSHPDQTNDLMMRDPYAQNNTQPQVFEHPCSPLTKILSSGTFYYATEPQWDVSSRLSQRMFKEKGHQRDIASYDERFVWNEYIVRSLLDLRDNLDPHEREEMDRCQFIVRYFLLPSTSTQVICIGIGYTRLCRCLYRSVTCAAYKRNARHRYHRTDISTWVETCWDAV